MTRHLRDVATDSTPTGPLHTIKCDRRTNPCGYCCPTFYATHRARHRAKTIADFAREFDRFAKALARESAIRPGVIHR